VSKDSVSSHEKFARNNDLNYPLLADSEGDLCKEFGVLNLLGIVKRSTFLIENGEIIKRFYKPDVKEHAMDVIEFLREHKK